MSIDDEDGYNANGPVPIGFACVGADIQWRGLMNGWELGLYSQARDPGPISGGVPPCGNVPPKSAALETARRLANCRECRAHFCKPYKAHRDGTVWLGM
jgi:hypothetical protein